VVVDALEDIQVEGIQVEVEDMVTRHVIPVVVLDIYPGIAGRGANVITATKLAICQRIVPNHRRRLVTTVDKKAISLATAPARWLSEQCLPVLLLPFWQFASHFTRLGV